MLESQYFNSSNTAAFTFDASLKGKSDKSAPVQLNQTRTNGDSGRPIRRELGYLARDTASDARRE